MNLSITLVQLADLAAIGLLPRVFFRRDGRFNARWWLTAAPFFGAAALLVAAQVGFLVRLPLPGAAADAVALAGLALAVLSIALIAYTLGTHTRPIALWHQYNDAPQHIVTHGAYARIRHPFYAAFLAGLAGVALYLPHWATFGVFVYALTALTVTARGEERRLLASPFGAEYREYMNRTGRFLPAWGSRHD